MAMPKKNTHTESSKFTETLTEILSESWSAYYTVYLKSAH